MPVYRLAHWVWLEFLGPLEHCAGIWCPGKSWPKSTPFSSRLTLPHTFRGFIHTGCTLPTNSGPVAGIHTLVAAVHPQDRDLRHMARETPGSPAHWCTPMHVSSSSCPVSLSLSIDPPHWLQHIFTFPPTTSTNKTLL